MRRTALIAIVAVMAGRAIAADAEVVAGERLIGQPPPGWKEAFATRREGFRLAEFVPADGPEQWIEKVTFEATAAAGLPDPIDHVELLARAEADACSAFRDYYVFSGYENGYPTSVRLFACARRSDANAGRIALLKVIGGDDYRYAIRWEKRVPAFDAAEEEDRSPLRRAEIGVWSAYLRGFSVCNPTAGTHPCPVQVPDATPAQPGAQ